MSTPFVRMQGAALLPAACLATAAVPALAGRRCEPQAPTVEAIERGMVLAVRTARALDDSGAEVVLLARAGQDLSAHGLRWSHLGVAYRDAGAQPAGSWPLALAVDGATTRRQAQGWLQARDYRPNALQLGAFTRLGARLSRANVAFDDHPNAQRFADRNETVTVDSVFDGLQRSGLGVMMITVR